MQIGGANQRVSTILQVSDGTDVLAEGTADVPLDPQSTATSSLEERPDELTDERLVERCLASDQQAWALLVARYKTLIYSFARRYGADRTDSADVFQAVCAELFTSLPRLRQHGCLRAWIMTVSAHQSYQWKRREIKRSYREGEEFRANDMSVHSAAPDQLEQLEREQLVREAVAELPERCQELVRMLFFSDPPVPYATVAQQLGMADGSVCFIRARCLRKLEQILRKAGI